MWKNLENKTSKEVYNDKVCQYCTRRNRCDKNKFNIFQNSVKTSIVCPEYEYENESKVQENVFVLN